MAIALEAFGNPSSVHAAGRASRALIEEARRSVARAIHADPADIVLTAGGTEACNLAVLGLPRPTSVVTSAIEHPALLAAITALCVPVELLSVEGGIAPDPSAIAERIKKDTLLALGWVNHETGTLLPLKAYAPLARRAGALLAIDATQALGKVPIDVRSLDADTVALGSGKCGGPSGAGAVWIRKGTPLCPRSLGGEQERGRRAGTPSLLPIVGFGAACEDLDAALRRMEEIGTLRDRLEEGLVGLGGRVNGSPNHRVATVTNVSFEGWESEVLVAALDLEGVCASNGPACSSGRSEPSRVVAALYPSELWRARSSVRFSLGADTTLADIGGALASITRVLSRKQRAVSRET